MDVFYNFIGPLIEVFTDSSNVYNIGILILFIVTYIFIRFKFAHVKSRILFWTRLISAISFGILISILLTNAVIDYGEASLYLLVLFMPPFSVGVYMTGAAIISLIEGFIYLYQKTKTIPFSTKGLAGMWGWSILFGLALVPVLFLVFVGIVSFLES